MFGSSRPRETRYIFGKAVMAKRNKSYVNIGDLKLRETNPTSFRETRPRELKPRSRFVWVHKTKGTRSKCVWQKAEGKEAHISFGSPSRGNKSYRNVGTTSLAEANPTSI